MIKNFKSNTFKWSVLGLATIIVVGGFALTNAKAKAVSQMNTRISPVVSPTVAPTAASPVPAVVPENTAVPAADTSAKPAAVPTSAPATNAHEAQIREFAKLAKEGKLPLIWNLLQRGNTNMCVALCDIP